MINPDLTYYGLFVAGVTQRYDGQPPTAQPELAITLKGSAAGNKIRLEQFASDMEVMNKVRELDDPAVREAYEQMLTVMALTNGRTKEKK